MTDTTLAKWSDLISPITGRFNVVLPDTVLHERTKHHFSGIPVKYNRKGI